MSSLVCYPTASQEALKRLYVGRSIHDVPTPAAILDISAVKRNCQRMLAACDALNLQWRAHIKTHKTVEMTRLQVGDDGTRPANIIVSTLAEAEFVLPLLMGYVAKGRSVNVLYGLPIAPGDIPRLAAVGRSLGPGSIGILLDDPDQVRALAGFAALSGIVPHAHIKIEMGSKRAGVVVNGERFTQVIDAALEAHANGTIVLSGLYSHAGHSYGGDSRVAALKTASEEFQAMADGAISLVELAGRKGLARPLPPLVLSAGATPTALSVQSLLAASGSGHDDQGELGTAAARLGEQFARVRSLQHVVEIHAGVYPTMDLQQLAAHSVSTSLQSWPDIAFSLLAEVHSVYPGRGEDGTPEVLIGAGAFAIGREACKAYPGLAMATPWGRTRKEHEAVVPVEMPTGEVEEYEGWIVGRFSQEHGILTWHKKTGRQTLDELQVGQKVKLWPNHSCITASHFGWYFVVDHSRQGKEDEIVDIFVRARGW